MPPLTLNLIQSKGTASCVGSLGHSEAMQQSGSIWHTNPEYPAASFPNNLCIFYATAGENVGYGGGDETSVITSIDAAMMAEGPGGGHHRNIMNPAFHQVGIGLVYVNSVCWLTTDFTN